MEVAGLVLLRGHSPAPASLRTWKLNSADRAARWPAAIDRDAPPRRRLVGTWSAPRRQDVGVGRQETRPRDHEPETNGFVERFKPSLEHERVYRREIVNAAELAEEVASDPSLYDEVRPLQALGQTRPPAVHPAYPHAFQAVSNTRETIHATSVCSSSPWRPTEQACVSRSRSAPSSRSWRRASERQAGGTRDECPAPSVASADGQRTVGGRIQARGC